MTQLTVKAANYREEIQKFQNGLITPVEFKKYCSSMGIYEERTPNSYMLRIRIPAGVLTLKELKRLSYLASFYSKGKIHLTTRQDIQFHGLSLENTADIIEELSEIKLFSYGSGGNCVRNVACSPSLCADNEVFDVTGYALKTSEFLLNQSVSFTLPRKFKIAFSNSPADTVYATIADLGFVAKIQDRIKGFELYGAGGLGQNASVSIKLENFIPADDFLYYVTAMLNLFNTEGDRENRNKARLRHVLSRLGEDEFRNLYKKYLAEATSRHCEQNEGSVRFGTKSLIACRTDSSASPQNDKKYSLYIHPEKGSLTTQDVDKIIAFLESLDYDAAVRLTPTQEVVIAGLKHKDKALFEKLFPYFLNNYEILNSVSCVGATVCKIGICKSQELLSEITERFKEEDTETKQALPKIHISGCPNSCGQHQVAKIGFSGKIKKINGKPVEFYNLFLGGNIYAGKTCFGQDFGELPAENIPEFLYRLAKLKISSQIACFDEFLQKNKEKLLKYTRLEFEEPKPEAIISIKENLQ